MELIKVDLEEKAELLFKLEIRAFYRDFDLPSRTVQEQKEYLQGSETYILYEEQTPVGFFAIKSIAEKIELLAIAVIPEKQGKGFGRIMMDKLLDLTKNKIIKLVTHPKNTSAIIFYLHSDFQIYGYKENYYGDGQPRLLLKHS